MKKRKTYEVSVINKTYSKTYSDQTKFYTSDTALELNFQLKEVEHDFDSAEIILLNVDDRSLVTRPVTKNADGFTYELEDDIVTHYGEWKGQLKFTEGGEIYVSSPVSFRIENDLTNDRPPQLTEVNTWKNLHTIADGLIDDVRSELALVAEQLSEIEGAETTRQQAETQRASAESSRVSAEEQRKTDHANRSAELASKADKVVLKNLATNGNFSQGTTGWSIATGSLSLTDKDYHSFPNSFYKPNPQATLYRNISLPNNHIAYLSTFIKGTNLMELRMNEFDTWVSIRSVSIKGSDEWKLISLTGRSVNGGIRIDTSASEGENYFDDFIVIDLTATFGAGNEPTQEEMDELIKVTGYIDGEYALNNKEMLGHLMKGIGEKANKKQEDWITLPLLNGAEHGASPLKVMKDEMGVVHFKGSLTNLRSGSNVFTVPIEYRPDIGVTESIIRLPVTLKSGRGFTALQINYVGDGYITTQSDTDIGYFDNISYVAKRG